MWEKFAGPFREFGHAAGAAYLLHRLLRRLSPHLGLFVYEFMAQPVTNRPQLPASLAKNLTSQEIERGDPAVALMPAREDIKALRFEQGSRCLGVYRKGTLLGYLWLSFGCHDEDEVRCTYVLAEPEATAFDFDLYVMPEKRLGIGFAAVWDAANRFLLERGVRCTFSRLTRFNVASRRSHAHLGARRVGSAVFFKAWGVEVMVATLAPWIGLTWGTRRIRLRLAAGEPQLSRASADAASRPAR